MLGMIEKSPVVVAEVIVTSLDGVRRLARMKVIGAPVLWTFTGPKSCEMGVRSRPWTDRAVPVRVRR